MAYIVNGKKVEYLYIDKKDEENITVTFSEKFNIVNAHISEILRKIRKNNLSVFHVSNDKKHDIITLCFKEPQDAHAILYALDIPNNCYEVIEDDIFNMIVIDVSTYQEKLEL